MLHSSFHPFRPRLRIAVLVALRSVFPAPIASSPSALLTCPAALPSLGWLLRHGVQASAVASWVVLTQNVSAFSSPCLEHDLVRWAALSLYCLYLCLQRGQRKKAILLGNQGALQGGRGSHDSGAAVVMALPCFVLPPPLPLQASSPARLSVRPVERPPKLLASSGQRTAVQQGA